jgi:hypothetical protein
MLKIREIKAKEIFTKAKLPGTDFIINQSIISKLIFHHRKILS